MSWRLIHETPPYKSLDGIHFTYQEILINDWFVVQFTKLAGGVLGLLGLIVLIVSWRITSTGLNLCIMGLNTALIGRLWWYWRRYHFKRIQQKEAS